MSPDDTMASRNEATASYVSASASANTPAAIVAQWNDSRDGFGIGLFRIGDTEWIRCTRVNCGPFHGPIVPASHQRTVVLPDVGTVGVYGSDPGIAGALAAPGAPGTGVVLAVVNGSSVFGDDDAIVAVASFDGGESFTESIIVNEGTGPCDINAPNGTYADRPRVAFDASGRRSTFWVVWAGGGLPCMRRVRANPDGLIHTLRAPGRSRIVPTVGIGSMIVRAHAGALYVMYNNTTPSSCGASHVDWYVTRSPDEGVSWANHLVYSTDEYDPCFGSMPSAEAPTLDTAQGNFGFDIAPDGTLWAAVHDTQNSIRVLRSSDLGLHWITSSVPSGVAANVGQPWLAADLEGNVAVTYYRATPPAGDSLLRMVAIRSAAAGSWSLPVPLSNPFAPHDDGSLGRIGDYQGITLVDRFEFPGHGSFFGVWTESNTLSPGFYGIAGAHVAVEP